MPYIKLDRRPRFDTIIDGIVKRTRELNYERETMRRLIANIVVRCVTDEAFPYTLSLNDIIKDLAKRVEVRGDVNYIICRVALESMKPEAGWSYHSLSNVIVVLEGAVDSFATSTAEPVGQLYDALSVCYDAADEVKRRLLGPYEDEAIRKNGDMLCFQEPFAYTPPIDMEFDVFGGCGCCCKTDSDNSLPGITGALTQDQIDAVAADKAARKTG